MQELRDENLPILLVSNHMSWWDGIWVLHYNQTFFHRKFHFMMMEEHLRKNWFLNHTGGFSVKKSSRSLLETINYTVDILKDNQNMVLIFPQGKIFSMHNKQFYFEKGIEKILKKIKNPIQIIFLANIVDFFSDAKPNLYMYPENYTGEYSLESLEYEYNKFYNKCISEQNKIETE